MAPCTAHQVRPDSMTADRPQASMPNVKGCTSQHHMQAFPMQLPPLVTQPSSKQLATSSDPSPQSSSSSSSSAGGGSSSGTMFSQHSHDADAAAMHRFITQGANSVNQPTSVLLARQRLMLQKLATAAEEGAQHDPHWAALKVKLEMQQAAVLRRLQVNNQVHEAQRQFTAIRLQDTQLKRPVAAKQTARASVTQRIIQELASEEARVLQPTSSASLSDLYAMETDEPCEPCNAASLSAASDAFAPAQTASLLCGAQPTSSASTSCSCPDGVAACCGCMEADAEGNALLCTEACDYESACMPRCRPPRAPLPKARAPAHRGLAVPPPQPAPSCPLPASLQASNGAQVLQSRLLPPLSSRLNKSQQATTQASGQENMAPTAQAAGAPLSVASQVAALHIQQLLQLHLVSSYQQGNTMRLHR